MPEAFDWIDSEVDVMLSMQRADGHIEDWYGDGNFNRTLLLYAYMKSQGVRPEVWEPGVRVGATTRAAAFRSVSDAGPTTASVSTARATAAR